MNKDKIFDEIIEEPPINILILTFIGASYVFINNANAGFAVIPCLFCIIFSLKK